MNDSSTAIQFVAPTKIVYAIFFMLCINCLTGCKKKATDPPNNNEVKATVVLSSGSTININAATTKALMGCAIYGGGTYVDGTDASNAAIYITVYTSTFQCISAPGTYSFDCEYRKDVSATNTPIYQNIAATNKGSITFTTINDQHMEGTFNAVCRYINDSVTVNGTFKGDHLN